MKPLLIAFVLLLPSSLFAQTTPTLNPMTELLTSLTPPAEPTPTVTEADIAAYLTAKEPPILSPREQRLADLEAEWQQRKAVLEAQLEVLRTAAAYAESAAKAAEAAAIANRYAPPSVPLWQQYWYPRTSAICITRPIIRGQTYVWCQ